MLDKIDPVKLNQTLGAIATAFNGRGEKIGKTLTDFNAFLAKIEPSLPNLSHDIEAAVPTLNAYADAAPDLVSTVKNSTQLSNSIVDEQQNLDEFLVSSIGLADVGNDVVGGNRQALTDVLHLLVPTTDLLNRYHDALWCGIGGLGTFTHGTPLSLPGIVVSAGLTLGVERYRYPADLPKVAAKGGPYCKELGLPDVQPEVRAPFIVADVGSNPKQVREPGHPAEFRGPQELVVRADRRAATQHRTDRNAGMRARATGTLIKFGIFAVVMAMLTAFLFFIFGQVRTGATNGYSAVFTDASRLEAGDTVRVAGIRVGTVKDVSLRPDR